MNESVLDKTKYDETIKKQNNTIMSLTDKLNEANNEITKIKVIEIVDSFCEDMTYEKTLKFYELIEDLDVDDLDKFTDKVKTLANVFEGKDEDEDEDDTEDEDEDNDDGDEDKGKKFGKKSNLKSKKINKKEIDDDEDEEKNENKIERPNDSFMNIVSKSLKS
jgi:hypothetical protein